MRTWADYQRDAARSYRAVALIGTPLFLVAGFSLGSLFRTTGQEQILFQLLLAVASVGLLSLALVGRLFLKDLSLPDPRRTIHATRYWSPPL